MRDDVELLVPARERSPHLPRLAVILTRIWIVLGVLATVLAFLAGSEGGKLGWRGALFTFAFFAIGWNVVAWIFSALPTNDEQR